MASLFHFSHAFMSTKRDIDKDLAHNIHIVAGAMKDDLNTAFEFQKNHDKKSHELYKALSTLESKAKEYAHKKSKHNKGLASSSAHESDDDIMKLKQEVIEAYDKAHKIYTEELAMLEKEFEIFEQLQDDQTKLDKAL